MTAAYAARALCLSAILGCQVGTRAKSFQPAQEPRGIQAEVRLWGSVTPLSVELLALQDTALIVVSRPESAPAQLMMIPLRSIEGAKCPVVGQSSFVKGGGYVSVEIRARINHLARYPQGVSPELMKLLLGDYGQSQVTRHE